MSEGQSENLVFKKIAGIPTYEDPLLLKAREKAQILIERAKHNEALVVIDELLTDVSTMDIPERHKIRRSFGKGGQLEKHQDGKEHKRQQLERALKTLRREITDVIEKLEMIVLDIESTKTK